MVTRTEARPGPAKRESAVGLAVLALAGDAALTASQVFPIALPMLIGMLWMNNVFIYYAGAAGIVLIAWILRPSFRIDGRVLDATEAPALHAALDDLRKKIGVPGRMVVHVDGDFNASVVETRGFFGLFGTRCVMTIGVPLLAAMSRAQVLAVMAHELGHFSRRHGRFGHWIYRARSGWLEHAAYLQDSDNALDQAAVWFAKRFVPLFSRRSFEYSRRCEYEADADAARAVGGPAFASALSWIAIASVFESRRFDPELADWQAREAVPPRDYHERFARGACECPATDLRAWLDESLARPSSLVDTHPSLHERLAAIGEPAVIDVPSDSAGEALVGAAWPALLAEFNERWVREMGGGWRLEHLRLRHLGRRHGVDDLRRLHEANPADRRIACDLGAALLGAGDAAGLEILETLAREAPAFRVAAFGCVAAYYDRIGDEREARRRRTWIDNIGSEFDRAVATGQRRADDGEGRASSLPADVHALFAEALAGEPCVGAAYLLECEGQAIFSVDKPPVTIVTQTLAIALDPAKLEQHGEDETEILRRYRALFHSVVPLDQMAVVRKNFTTEDLPAGVLAHPLR
ncbi:Protease HtpX [Usitatibacter rugosus]|uniref:Protease HtpX n=1 Tax=Usitatibacter rugosus TaxID=2732067 RepID=A0A6M4GYV2_9PROT|nr:M48 family metallopeptidase [Usitatibacter rugosus]QJR12441.1 Protease HtpX [Usitatibacter rugosus]